MNKAVHPASQYLDEVITALKALPLDDTPAKTTDANTGKAKPAKAAQPAKKRLNKLEDRVLVLRDRVDTLGKAYSSSQPRDERGRWAASASYKDSSGYTSHVKAYSKPPAGSLGPQGAIFVQHPKGRTVESISNWMDYPEYGWKHNGVDLRADWNKHEAAGTVDKSYWRTKVPLQTRLAMEAKQQATGHKTNPDYGTLKQQFAEYSGIHR